MYSIKKLNNISSKGTSLMSSEKYSITEDILDADAVLLRSYSMHEMELPQKLKSIARAGAGVNNIPVDKCTEKGIVVFNTPGANANAVKELVLASLFLSSRKVFAGITWAQSLKDSGEDIPKLVEKGKSQFEGPEIKGKRLGVIGLGAIGVMVANDALALGMEVIGYDPFISIDAAWELSSTVIKAASLEQLISTSDYITIHVPLNAKTEGMFDKTRFSIMKHGVRIINLARGGLIVNSDILNAIESGIVACYVTDFPEAELIGNDCIITVPHLGASTPESEENCAVMAVKQTCDFLETGNVKNSVNFPECVLAPSGDTRIIVAHENIPNMVGQATTAVAKHGINIVDMLSRNKNTIGYTMIDIEGKATEQVIDGIKAINGIKMVRAINTTRANI